MNRRHYAHESSASHRAYWGLDLLPEDKQALIAFLRSM